MNVQSALNLLMARLGNRTETSLRANCLLEMQLVQETKLEGGPELPFFITSETISTVTPSDGIERRVEVPDDFLREIEEDALYIVEDDGSETALVKGNYDDLVEEYGSDGTGDKPLKYALVGNYFELFPIPLVERVLKMRCYLREDPPADTANSENAWFKWIPDLIIAETGLVVATLHLQDVELQAIFTGLINDARDRFGRLSTAREEAGRSRTMG